MKSFIFSFALLISFNIFAKNDSDDKSTENRVDSANLSSVPSQTTSSNTPTTSSNSNNVVEEVAVTGSRTAYNAHRGQVEQAFNSVKQQTTTAWAREALRYLEATRDEGNQNHGSVDNTDEQDDESDEIAKKLYKECMQDAECAKDEAENYAIEENLDDETLEKISNHIDNIANKDGDLDAPSFQDRAIASEILRQQGGSFERAIDHADSTSNERVTELLKTQMNKRQVNY